MFAFNVLHRYTFISISILLLLLLLLRFINEDCHHILFIHIPAGLAVVLSLAAVELGSLVDGVADGLAVSSVTAPPDVTMKCFN